MTIARKLAETKIRSRARLDRAQVAERREHEQRRRAGRGSNRACRTRGQTARPTAARATNWIAIARASRPLGHRRGSGARRSVAAQSLIESGVASVARHAAPAERRLAHRGEELARDPRANSAAGRRAFDRPGRGPGRTTSQRRGADPEKLGRLADVEKPLACFHDSLPGSQIRRKCGETCVEGGLVAALAARRKRPTHCASNAQVPRENL